MNTRNEQLQQQRIDVLTETIAIMNRRILSKDEHRQHLNETISNQAHQLESKHKTIDLLQVRIELEKETTKLNAETIGKLFAAAKKDKEAIKQFKQLISQQGKQIIDLQQDNDKLFAANRTNETTLILQKEVNKLSE